MPNHGIALAAAALAMVLLTFAVALRLFFCRAREMRAKRIRPQSASTSIQVAARLEDVRGPPPYGYPAVGFDEGSRG